MPSWQVHVLNNLVKFRIPTCYGVHAGTGAWMSRLIVPSLPLLFHLTLWGSLCTHGLHILAPPLCPMSTWGSELHPLAVPFTLSSVFPEAAWALRTAHGIHWDWHPLGTRSLACSLCFMDGPLVPDWPFEVTFLNLSWMIFPLLISNLLQINTSFNTIGMHSWQNKQTNK